jgi:RNA polymerase sigma factor (sigma-70 family)
MRTPGQTAVAEVPGLEAIINGNYNPGWEEFYNHYITTVTNQVTSSGALEGGVDAEDVAHDIFIKLARNTSALLKKLRNNSDKGVKSYLAQAARRANADLIKMKVDRKTHLGHAQTILDEDERETFTEDEIEPGYVFSRHPRPDKVVELWEFEDLAKEVLEDLRPIDRKIVLGLLDALTKTEIAHELGLDPGNMTNRANRAQETARKLLNAKSPETYRQVIRRGGGKKNKTRVNARKGLKAVNSSML